MSKRRLRAGLIWLASSWAAMIFLPEAKALKLVEASSYVTLTLVLGWSATHFQKPKE